MERVVDPADARARLIALTSRGENAAQQYLGVVIGWFAEAMSNWPAADHRDLTRLLTRMSTTSRTTSPASTDAYPDCMTPSIRPAEPGDADAVAAIWYAGWRDGHLGHVPDDLVAVRTKESFWTRAAERIADTTVAVVGDDVAGFVMVVRDEVEQVYVSRDHRGSGVAGVLLGEAERQVTAGGHSEAWLAVATGNARARRFYERSGWSDGGAFDYPASVGDRTLPVPCHRYLKPV